jgi:hypothetical protein
VEDDAAVTLLHNIPDEPELAAGSEFHLEAFNALTTDRQIGAMGGAGPIPWSSMDRYAARHEITGDAYDHFLRMLKALDGAYLAFLAEQAQRERERVRS